MIDEALEQAVIELQEQKLSQETVNAFLITLLYFILREVREINRNTPTQVY
jgi:hypothetical protein